MEIVKLTEELVTSLVKDKDLVAVKEFETDEYDTVLLQIMVADSDMPRVIGRGGKTINAIRTIVQASSYIQDNKTVKINVDSI